MFGKLDFTKVALLIVLIMLVLTAGLVFKQQLTLAEERGRNQVLNDILQGKTSRKEVIQSNNDSLSPSRVDQNALSKKEQDLIRQIEEENNLNSVNEGSDLALKEKEILSQSNKSDQSAENVVEKKIQKLNKLTNNSIEDRVNEKNKIKFNKRIKNIPSLAKVKEVEKKFSFLVMNLGKDGKIRKGSMYGVKRDEKFIGVIIVDTVEDNVSIANIIEESLLENHYPQIGDDIIYPPPY